MNCPKCQHSQLYTVQLHYKKCAKCHYKFSLKRYEQDLAIIKLFCSNKTAQEAAKALQINYRTVSKKYILFRRLIAQYLQEQYDTKAQDNSSYEEYYYFTQRQKNKRKKSLYEAINIIGFYSNKKVFTLLMPPLIRQEKEQSNENFERYLTWHKLQSQNAYKTPLKVFFAFCEQNLKKYKGVQKENFFYYLKECEFKYNYLLNEQIEILKQVYF